MFKNDRNPTSCRIAIVVDEIVIQNYKPKLQFKVISIVQISYVDIINRQ